MLVSFFEVFVVVLSVDIGVGIGGGGAGILRFLSMLLIFVGILSAIVCLGVVSCVVTTSIFMPPVGSVSRALRTWTVFFAIVVLLVMVYI